MIKFLLFVLSLFHRAIKNYIIIKIINNKFYKIIYDQILLLEIFAVGTHLNDRIHMHLYNHKKYLNRMDSLIMRVSPDFNALMISSL